MPQSKNCPFLSQPNDALPTIALIYRTAHYCSTLLNERLEVLGLTCKSFLVLGAAFNNTSFSQQDIAKGMFIDRTTMVGLVDDLETRGLVERIRHADDRRQYRVVLTADGEDLLKKAREIACQTESEYLSVLDAEQKMGLREALLQVLNATTS